VQLFGCVEAVVIRVIIFKRELLKIGKRVSMDTGKFPLIVDSLYKKFQPKSLFWQKPSEPFIAVNKISFALHSGEILGLLGPNGAGKTTTIHMLLGVMQPTSGTITYFGKDFAQHRSEILTQVSFASTYVRLPGRLTVYENLKFYSKIYVIPYHEQEKRIEHLLKLFDLWKIKDRKAGALSAGEMTRAILAKAFLPNPKIVLLDEPTASLDPDIAHEVRNFVLQQRKERSVSILFTSHNMDEVAQICDRVLVLKNGNIIAQDAPTNLAASVSQARLNFISEQIDRLKAYADEKGFPAETEGRAITIEVDEHAIAQTLSELAQRNITYSQISIEKPTLEDYFLTIAARKKLS
jgi:ABC-2 type transport system ATP-binding protein